VAGCGRVDADLCVLVFEREGDSLGHWANQAAAFIGAMELYGVQCLLDLLFDTIGRSQRYGPLELALDPLEFPLRSRVVNFTYHNTIVIGQVVFF